MQNRKWSYIKQIFEESIIQIKYFNFFYWIGKVIIGLVPRKFREKNTFCIWISGKCNSHVLHYLEKYLYVIEEYHREIDRRSPGSVGHFPVGNGEDYDRQSVIGTDSPIWVFWWQGMDCAPDIVKVCVKSIERNAEKHRVVLLDSRNYRKYVNLPDCVMEKFEKGRISYTHFSDILRVCLLYEYGGIWMDATIFMNHPLERAIEERLFYSTNTGRMEKGPLPLGKWTSFFMAACKGNEIVGMLRKLFFAYWKNEDYLLVYLLIDFFFTLIYDNVGEVREVIDNIPVSNQDIFKLDEIINKPAEELKLLNDSTYIYKLSYKKDLRERIQGKTTIYGKMLHEGDLK